MPGQTFIVGVYASMPPDRGGQADYYRLLGDQSWIDGAELPYPGDLADADARAWLAGHLPAHWHANAVTAIPGTMRTLGTDPSFGLASPDADGRAAAVAFAARIRDAIADLADRRGHQDVTWVHLHTAPTGHPSPQAMAASLEELAGMDWMGAVPVIEHCDRYIEGRRPEKGFLPIGDELDIAAAAGVGVTVNWGRSAVEGRDAAIPLAHVRSAAERGVLSGVMFSGAGPEASQYGYPWIDGHLPMREDEPTSLMGADEVRSCVRAALGGTTPPSYFGAKMCVPASSALEERLAMIRRVYDAVRSAADCGPGESGESGEAGGVGTAGDCCGEVAHDGE